MQNTQEKPILEDKNKSYKTRNVHANENKLCTGKEWRQIIHPIPHSTKFWRGKTLANRFCQFW